MKKQNLLLILGLFIIPSLFLNAQSKENMDAAKKIIEEVKGKYAPDKRVAWFDIKPQIKEEKLVLKGKTNLEEAKAELIEGLKKSGIEANDQIVTLPSEELKGKDYAVVNLSVCNIRSAPKHSAEMATQAMLGTPVKVLDYDKNGFYQIQTPDDYISWVDASGIARKTKDELDEWYSAKKVIFMKEYDFVYSRPDTKSSRVSDVIMGNILKYVGEEGEFTEVEFPDGRRAFAEKKYCKDYSEWLAAATPEAESLIELGKSYMGLPYLWGGTSPKAMDCSGFMKVLYFLHGVILDRDASQQYYKGELVETANNDFSKLQKGDLIFFGKKARNGKKERATHVALYIGNGEYIHESGRIRINSLDKDADNFSEYRLKSFLGARRVITSLDKNGITTIKNNPYYSGVK